MFKRTKLSTAALFALSSAMLALPVLAQERVEITGSRFKTTETEGSAPVISLSAETIRIEAVRNVESLLNNLPQVFADYGAQVSNGASGTATVNLRNLGADRTLVLVNGRRLPYGSPRLAASDLNQIPVSLIKRVDVLTGGASAVYGADAVAGVVNFVMNDRFEGLQLELNHQFYNHQQGNPSGVNDALNARKYAIPGDKDADGEITDFSITVGGNFAGNKGNAALYFGYKQEKALLQSERDFSSCAFGTAGDKFSCGGSGTSFPGRFIAPDGKNYTVADAAGNTRPYVGANDAYNFGPLNYFQRPSDRYTVATYARYDISDMARTYLEASFHDDRTVAQIAPSGLFGFDASGANAIRFENPLLTPAWRTALGLKAPGDTADVLIFRRNVEGGGRQDDIRHTSFRIVTGVKGDIGPISYDVFAQTGKVIYQETYKNDFSIARSARAMDVVTDPATGQAVCRSALDGTDPACVPYNIWKLGGVTPGALGYLGTPGFQKGFTSQTVIGGNVAIDLGQYGVKLPTAQNGLGLVIGAERRSEKLDLSVDTAFATGDLAGQGGPTPPVGGQYSVKDVYAELRVPLMEKKPFVELLSLSASYRYSDYSTGTSSDTYGVGLEYAPLKSMKLRGSVQRAVRSPNVIDLFTPQAVGLWNLDNDPCGPKKTATLVECQRTGLTAAQYGSDLLDSPAGQFNTITGGNDKLKPETSDSVTLGFVFSPTRDVDVTIDYFNIKVKGGIGTVPQETTLDKCLKTGDSAFCSLIQRDSRGTLWATPNGYVSAQNANLGREATTGFDLGVNYRAKMGAMGQLDMSFIGTLMQKYESEPVPGDGSYDCAGYFGNTCGTVTTGVLPKWRHKLRTTWNTPWKTDLTLTWRYLSSVKHETASSNPLLNGTVDPVMAKFPSFNYFDISAKYDLTKNLAIRFAINNLFDKDPPLAVTGAPYGNGNTYPVMYDALGRKVSLNLTASF